MKSYQIIDARSPPGLSTWNLMGQNRGSSDWVRLSIHETEASAEAAKAERERPDTEKFASVLHVFQSSKMPEVYGFTVDEGGVNLPPEGGPWGLAGNGIPLGTTMASTSPEISEQIARYGYALVKGHTVGREVMSRRDSAP